MKLASPRRHYRTVFLSDVHLGTRACKAELLADFLRHVRFEELYLVGDIVDGWRLKKNWYWDEHHDVVVRKVLKRARKGARVVFVPGNHDEAFRPYVGHALAGIELRREAVHETADGRRLLVVHGDEHDVICQHARWLAHLGDFGYELSVTANRWINGVLAAIGRPYWSLPGFLKRTVKKALEHVDSFEQSLAAEARRRGLDGVVCGHVHTPKIREVDGVLYCNDGDWVDTCTALVEHEDGRLEIVDWLAEVERRRRLASEPARLAEEHAELEAEDAALGAVGAVGGGRRRLGPSARVRSGLRGFATLLERRSRAS